MPDEVMCCGYCRLPIKVTRGHRPKRYCNDACRQAAHRQRLEAARRAEEEAAHLARIQQERISLMKRYGNLLPGTLDLLQTFQSVSLVEKVVKVIIAERENACLSEAKERNMVMEDLLLIGEQLGYQILTNDDFMLEAGVESWLAFGESASLGQLYQARDIARIKIQAESGRKRLVQLSR